MAKKAQKIVIDEIVVHIQDELAGIFKKFDAMTDEELREHNKKVMQQWWKKHWQPVERQHITINLNEVGKNEKESSN